MEIINKVIDKNKKAVEDFKGGKENALMFLLGQSMRELKGQAEPKIVKQKLLEKLKKI
jgi:aspartyl-tRNA(Asn)/glutamyl-tRNA(Gln) amidotransferase subunit B